MYTILVDINIVPEIIDAIHETLLKSERRYYCSIVISTKGNVRVSMDGEREIREMGIYGRGEDDDEECIKFNFDQGEIPYQAEDRKPTPAMKWVMDTLQEFYDQWKQEQESASTTPSGSDGQTGVSIM